MLKDVEEYARTVDEAKALHARQVEEAQQTYEEAATRSRTEFVDLDAAYRTFNRRTSAANELKAATVRLAWAKLGFSGEPLVAYIATRIPQNRREEYADYVLRALPATHQQLRDLADRKSWCGEFEGFLRDAILDGVLDDGRSAEVRNLEAYLVDNVNRRYVDEIMRRVAAVVVAEVKSAVAASQEAQTGADGGDGETVATVVPEHLTSLVSEPPSRDAAGDLLEADNGSDGPSAPETASALPDMDRCTCPSCMEYRRNPDVVTASAVR